MIRVYLFLFFFLTTQPVYMVKNVDSCAHIQKIELSFVSLVYTNLESNLIDQDSSEREKQDLSCDECFGSNSYIYSINPENYLYNFKNKNRIYDSDQKYTRSYLEGIFRPPIL